MMKRNILFTTLLCLSATLSWAQDELPANPITPDIDLNSPVIICGDVNNDGTVTMDDAIAISNHIIGKETPIFIEEAADVSGDGKVDIRDLTMIIGYVVSSKQ